jgi:hypothetical protein
MKTVSDNFSVALGAFNSQNSQALLELIKGLVKDMGIGCAYKARRAIGTWELGANLGCVMSLQDSLPMESAIKVAAKLGLATNSPHVMAFIGGAGSETLHYFKTPITDTKKVRLALESCKLKTYSLIPGVRETIVLLHDPKSKLYKNFEVLSKTLDGTNTVIKGSGQYLGSDASDEETAGKKSKQKYREVLGISSPDNPDPKSTHSDKNQGKVTNGSKAKKQNRSSSKGSVGSDGLARRPGTFSPK